MKRAKFKWSLRLLLRSEFLFLFFSLIVEIIHNNLNLIILYICIIISIIYNKNNIDGRSEQENGLVGTSSISPLLILPSLPPLLILTSLPPLLVLLSLLYSR